MKGQKKFLNLWWNIEIHVSWYYEWHVSVLRKWHENYWNEIWDLLCQNLKLHVTWLWCLLPPLMEDFSRKSGWNKWIWVLATTKNWFKNFTPGLLTAFNDTKINKVIQVLRESMSQCSLRVSLGSFKVFETDQDFLTKKVSSTTCKNPSCPRNLDPKETNQKWANQLRL